MNNPKIEGPFHGGWNKCDFCGEKDKSNQEYRRNWDEELFKKTGGKEGRDYYCIPCGKRISAEESTQENKERKKHKEQREIAISEKAENLPTELRQLWDDLEPKVKHEDLEVKDIKRIYALKKEISKFLTESKNVSVDSDHWTKIKITSDLLQKTPADLDNFIKENASPRTIDIANKGKFTRIRDCHHEKSIEPCTDNPNFFCCSYCWDTESPEFLKKLRRKHTDSINKLLDKHGINVVEFTKNSNHYKKLTNDFTTQEELNLVYQATEQDLQTYLKKKKGITITTARERERERERIQIKKQQLHTEIMNLESQPTKTPEQEQELVRKKKDLQKLEEQQRKLEEEKKRLEQEKNKDKDSNLGLKVGIGAVVVVVFVGLVVVLVRRKNRKN